MLRSKPKDRAQHWFWGASIGMGLGLVVVVCVLHYVNDHSPHEAPSVVVNDRLANEPGVVASSVLPTIEPVVAIQEPQLPALDFSPGSIEEACGLNGFPPYWVGDDSLRSNRIKLDMQKVLESDECWAALETHVSTINPYLWREETLTNRQFAFIVLEEPLTFERIFADPVGDLAQVQDALSRSECLLEHTEADWELKETCHAEAFLNYALINRFCFDDGVSDRRRTIYWPEDNPTPEQDRLMWKQHVEDYWVKRKCENLDTMLELTSAQYPALYARVMSFDTEKRPSKQLGSRELLIELAARFGDPAAGLTRSIAGKEQQGQAYYKERGYKHGRFAELLNSDAWWKFALKKAPSAEHFLKTFKMLARLDASRADPRDEMEFDWEWVARHLCAPPYEKIGGYGMVVPVKNGEHQSCREVVHEIRQQGISFLPLTLALDKFEQVALELEVYE